MAFGRVLASHSREHHILLVEVVPLARAAARLGVVSRDPNLKAWLQAGGAYDLWSWDWAGRDQAEPSRCPVSLGSLPALPRWG